MSEKKISSLEKIGYIKLLPKGADINNYENISIKKKNGETLILYRALEDRKEIDDIGNFSNSWNVFNSFL